MCEELRFVVVVVSVSTGSIIVTFYNKSFNIQHLQGQRVARYFNIVDIKSVTLSVYLDVARSLIDRPYHLICNLISYAVFTIAPSGPFSALLM
jgi:Ni/Fe-hydrogenase subunit HybB-like protein